MSCEAEEAAVNQASAAVAEKAAYCASICGSAGQDSIECSGCRGEVADLQGKLSRARASLAKCRDGAGAAGATRLLQIEGHVTFLLIVEPGSGYGGGATNWIDADVIFKLDSRPDLGFGFQLRDDGAEPARAGMLSLLREAIVHRIKVTTDYNELIAPPNQNGIVIRVAVSQLPDPAALAAIQPVDL